MSGSSLLALASREGENDNGADDPKAKLRAEIAKGNLPKVEGEAEPEKKEEKEEADDDEENEDDEEKDDEEDDNDKKDDKKVEETDEEKAEREKNEKITAKAQRKQDRMQRRIDDAIAAKSKAEEKVAALEAQLKADPDKTLTSDEIKRQAKAMADEAMAAKEIEDLQIAFKKDCDDLAKAATKIDKDFNDKVNDMAETFGPIPSFMIGVLKDLENGGEVLAHIANDEDVAEKIYGFKSLARMTKEIVEISTKLADAKKPKKKEISKVPDQGTAVKNSRVQSTVITEADTKNMDSYVAKRQKQIIERRKAQGFG